MSEERSDKTNRIATLNIVSGLRETLMLRTFQLGLVLLIPFLGFGIFYLWRSGLFWLIPLPIIALIMLVAGATDRLSHMARALVLAAILFGFGALDLVLFGWMSDTRVFLLSSIICASFFISKRTGYGFWGGGTALTFGYLVTTYAGWIKPLQGNNIDSFSLRIVREWIFYVCLGGGLVATISYWLTKLYEELDETKVNCDALCDERKIVAERTEAIQYLTNDLQKRETILDATASVTRSLTLVQPLRPLLALTVDLITQYFGFEHAGIYLMDESEAWVDLYAASSEAGKKLLAQDFRLRVDESSVVGWVANNRQMKCVNFERDDAETKTNSGFTALRAELVIPILIAGDIVGVLDLQSSTPSAFDDYGIDVLQRMVSELALVMSTARRLDGIPVMEIANPFYYAGQRIASARTDTAIYEAVLEVMVGYNPSRLTFVRKHDESDELYTALDMKNGQTSFVRQSVETLDLPMAVIAQYGSSLQKPIWLEASTLDLLELPEHLNQMMLNDHGVNSVAIIPALAGGSLIGVLISLFDNPHSFSQIEMRLYRLVADLTAMAIERNTLIENAAARAAQERILGGVRSRLRSSLDPDVILRTTVQEIGQLLEAELTAVEIAVNENRETPDR